LPGFCRIESGGGSGGKPLMWPPLWGPCLPKIGHGSPEITFIIFFDKGIHSSVLFIINFFTWLNTTTKTVNIY
jgi:hypothetical protein